jgi:hypothetical protein
LTVADVDRPPQGFNNIVDYMGAMPPRNVSTTNTRISWTTAIDNTYDFINATYDGWDNNTRIALWKMNTYLLQSRVRAHVWSSSSS